MRLLSLVLALGILSWLVFTYMDSNTVIKTDEDKTVKEQVVETLDEAQQAADSLQKSLDEQTKRMNESQ